MRICSEATCERPTKARGLCSRHYQRAQARGTLDLHARSLVHKGASLDERLRHHGWDENETGCWIWRGSITTYGYGQLAVGTDRPMLASRAAYAAWVGPLGDGGAVCHTCDNPPCINPGHLFLADRAANNADTARKRRTANGELKSSSRLTDVQVAEIRAAYATGDVYQRDLAQQYGVSQSLISGLVRYKRRAHPTNWR